jgi:DNA-binding transcriptional ArsR family regulator
MKMRKTESMKIKEAQGQKSRKIASENLTKVFFAIAQKRLSFSELLEETKLSKPVLAKHLKTLQEQGVIYKDIIKLTDTFDSSEVGKIVYKMKEDEMESFLMEAVNTNFTIADLVEDEELRQKLNGYAKEIAKAIFDYVTELRASREQSLKAELERIKKK